MSAPKRWSDLHVALFEQRILLVGSWLIGGGLLVSSHLNSSNLTRQLRQKEYILAPGLTDFARVTPGLIAPQYVQDFAETLASHLGNFTGASAHQRYRRIESYLSSELRIRFRQETTADLKELAAKDIAEMFVPTRTEVVETDGGFSAHVFGQHFRYIAGLKVYKGSHVMGFTLRPVPPQSATPWALQVTHFQRQAEADYLKSLRSRP